ncbi:hypothetical protein Tco_0529942 [Tanacetum coccineum]
MEIEEVCEHYITPGFMEGLDAYDGVTDFEYEKILISNEFVVKVRLTFEVMKNEEDDVEPCVIFGRSFLKLSKAIVDFGNGILTIWLKTITFNSDDEELDALLASINTYKMSYDGEGPSLTINRLRTQDELTREEIGEDLYERIMLLNERRPVFKTLKYSD